MLGPTLAMQCTDGFDDGQSSAIRHGRAPGAKDFPRAQPVSLGLLKDGWFSSAPEWLVLRFSCTLDDPWPPSSEPSPSGRAVFIESAGEPVLSPADTGCCSTTSFSFFNSRSMPFFPRVGSAAGGFLVSEVVSLGEGKAAKKSS